MSEVTQILNQLESGDPAAAGQLLPLVYAELRQLAAAKLAQEKPGHTLQATALVHEAYLRLVGNDPLSRDVHWNGRSHFFGAAAEAMRRILVESFRRKQSRRHGGDSPRVELIEDVVAPQPGIDLIALDDLLESLGQHDARKAELVKLRFFVGLTLREAAAILGISESTADADWAYAKAWLKVRLAD